MAKSQPEWHESLVAILERRARLIGEVRRSRTLSSDSRKLALRAIEDEAFASARRVFPSPAPMATVTSISPQSFPNVTWGTGASSG
jgi:hypothetical protein